MNDQRRILIAFFLMAAVLVGTQWWYGRMVPPEGSETSEAVEGGEVDTPVPDAATAPDVATAPDDTTMFVDSAATDEAPLPPIVIETPLYRLRIDPRGGTIRQVELLRYPSFTRPGPVELVPPEAEFLRRAADLEQGRLAIQDLVFSTPDSAIVLSTDDAARTLTLSAASPEGRVAQSYRFDPGDYIIDYALELERPVDGILVTGIAPRLQSNEKNPRDDYDQLRAVLRVDGEIVDMKAGDVDEGERFSVGGPIEWAGLRNKYFLAMVLAPADGPALTAVTIDGATGDSLVTLEVATAAPIEGGRAAYRLFLGPQEYRRLSALNDGLDGVSQYGWSWVRWMITPFAKLIVVCMLWLHQFIPSYGLVLLVFALLVRVISWPLTSKAYQSIQAMQELQPEIQRIREQYKGDPQKMQQETMRLYKERKVNPLGGCLPNLIPMPILFALFFVFQSTIEFRGASFLWLPDLSQPDPFYILPVFMGLTMMASSKITATDPRMNAMTYIMPIVLTFVFLSLASGLVLYYAVSNLLTFGQQWWLKRGAPEKPPAEAAKASEKAVSSK